MKDGKYLYSGIEGRAYLRIKDGSYECLTADTNTGWGEGKRGDIDELIPSMWELIEDPEVTELREQLAKANERIAELEKELKESDDDLSVTQQQSSQYENALEEVQAVFVDSDACPLFEPFNPRNLSAWLNKFAIEKKIEALTSLIEHEASTFRLHNGNKRSGVFSIDIKHRIEALKLSKEQEK